jgi:hypothetical protein
MNNHLFIPTFMNDPDIDLSTIEAKDFLTEQLRGEITSHFPVADDIGVDGVRSLESFEKHASELFPSGRIFANYVQLREAVLMFQKAWGASVSHGSSRMCCYYGKPSRKPRVSVCEPDKQRTRLPSLKERLCPFKIQYSIQGMVGPNKKNRIHYRVKITTVDYEHTCELSPTSCRLALKGSGKLIPDLAGLQDVLSILREHPTLDHKVLRTLLQKYVPFYLALDGTYIRNFRLRALTFDSGSTEITMVDARALTSHSRSAADEFVTSDNPIFAKNFKGLLQKTMQEGGDTWIAMRYFKALKEEVPGFDFRFKYDEDGRPTAICWMLPHMRTNLLRYGDVLFLDAMMKDFNEMHWPYIGPTVKDGEMKIRQVAECVAIGENLDVYQFVIESMASMEKRWKLSDLHILFADMFITKTLLENLGIVSTCTLHCDYYHIVNEVWPKQLGASLYNDLKPYLTRMLKSTNEVEHKLSFDSAMKLIVDDPIKTSYIELIYNNPDYYSGYYLKRLVGNLKMMGDAPAEQNH